MDELKQNDPVAYQKIIDEREKEEAETAKTKRAAKLKEEASERQESEKKKQYDIYWSAVFTCKKMVEADARFPTKADFDWGIDGNYKSRLVQGRVELMNGLGSMIPHRFQCKFDDNGAITDFLVIPG